MNLLRNENFISDEIILNLSRMILVDIKDTISITQHNSNLFTENLWLETDKANELYLSISNRRLIIKRMVTLPIRTGKFTNLVRYLVTTFKNLGLYSISIESILTDEMRDWYLKMKMRLKAHGDSGINGLCIDYEESLVELLKNLD